MKSYVLCLVLILNLISISISAQEIAQWRGPNRDGKYTESGLLKQWPELGPTLLWHFDELGSGHASAAVTKSAIFTSVSLIGKDYIYAIDHNGILLWKTEVGDAWTENYDGARSTPLVYGDKLYYCNPFAVLTCLNASTGEIVWVRDLIKEYGAQKIMWGITENLLIDDNKLFVTPCGKEVMMLALNPQDGSNIWTCKGNGEQSAYCSPIAISATNGRRLIVTQTMKSIIGVDILTGQLLWQFEQINQWSVHANSPTYAGGLIYCVSGYGKGGVQIKLSDDGSSVTEVWRNESLDYRMGGVVLLNGIIYGADDQQSTWFGIDWKTGKQIFEAPILSKGNIIYADGLLYLYGDKGEVALVEPIADGMSLISKFKVPFGDKQQWAHPVIANKKLYIRHGISLMVFDIAAK